MMIEGLFACVFILLCLYAAMRDVETLTISNGLNAIIAFLFIPAMIVAAPGWDVAGGHSVQKGFVHVSHALDHSHCRGRSGDRRRLPCEEHVGPAR